MKKEESAVAENYIEYAPGHEQEERVRRPSIAEMQDTDRPFERAKAYGVGTLADADLLALILRSGLPGNPITETCRTIMRGYANKFRNLSRATMEELTKFPGVGEVKAMQILAMMEIILRYNSEAIDDAPLINSSEAMAKVMMPIIGTKSEEYIYIASLSQSLRLKKLTMLTKGVATASVFDVKAAVRAALLGDAQAVMLCHNHPSGQMRPSPQDDQITRSLKNACEMLNLRFLDHVIVGGGTPDAPKYYSYHDEGRL